MTLAQQYNDLFRYNGSDRSEQLKAFAERYEVSTGVSCTDGTFSYSRIFADGSVWGYCSIFEYETELDNFGYNRIEIYNTIYCQ